jgi:hypothetical protein
VDAILRFTGAVKRDPRVDAWLADPPSLATLGRDPEIPLALRGFAQQWFARMRRCGADVRELVHDGCPVACVEDAPFGYVNAFANHVNVGFFHGSALPDPARLLEGSGKRMRHVKLRPGQELDSAALADLIDAAYLNIKMLLRVA